MGSKAALIGAGLVVGAGLIGTAWYGARAPAAPDVTAPNSAVAPAGPIAASPDRSSSSEPALADSASMTASSQAVAASPPERPTPARQAETAPGSAARARSGAASASGKSTPARQSEAALLDAARASLASNPERALRLTEEHARRFPQGDLVQEREVIAISALERLGKSRQAVERGDAFERRYPGSVHQKKVDQTPRGK